MISYHIAPPEALPIKKRLAGALVRSVISLLLYDVLLWLISSPRRWLDWEGLVIGVVVYFTVDLFWKPRAAGYDLEIDDGDSIRLLRNGAISRKVRRDRIRYVREWGGNIFRRPVMVISERGAIGTRFLGGITVPKSVPEYELIKTQALAWLTNSKA
jgi:hypothetical protein